MHKCWLLAIAVLAGCDGNEANDSPRECTLADAGVYLSSPAETFNYERTGHATISATSPNLQLTYDGRTITVYGVVPELSVGDEVDVVESGESVLPSSSMRIVATDAGGLVFAAWDFQGWKGDEVPGWRLDYLEDDCIFGNSPIGGATLSLTARKGAASVSLANGESKDLGNYTVMNGKSRSSPRPDKVGGHYQGSIVRHHL